MTAMNIHVNIVAESNKEMRDVPILFIVEWSLELPRIEHSGALQAQSHPKKRELLRGCDKNFETANTL